MNEQLLKMNGLSMGILDALSFESHLGIPLKKNLHYFDRNLLIAELMAMTEWLDEQEILSDIALDYRIKSLDSILLKYDRYYPDYQTEYSSIGGSSAIIRYYCYIPCTSTLLQATACHIFHTLYVLSFLICY